MNQTEWDILEKDFYENLKSYFDELYESVLILRAKTEENDKPYVRSQLCIAFIAIDTFARFNEIFKGTRGDDLDKNNEKRFKRWVKEFILDDDNEVFKSMGSRFKMNEDLFWKLRNSLLHFYSFPKSIDGQRLGFVYNVPENLHTKVKREMKQHGHNVKFVDSNFLIEAIFMSFTLFMSKLMEQIEASPDEYIESVKYAYKIVLNENMKTLQVKN